MTPGLSSNVASQEIQKKSVILHLGCFCVQKEKSIPWVDQSSTLDSVPRMYYLINLIMQIRNLENKPTEGIGLSARA